MELIICRNDIEGGELAATIIAQSIHAGATTLGLATGSTPLSTYRALIQRYQAGLISFAAVSAFLLDEYIGLPLGHSQSYKQFIQDNFAAHVDFQLANIYSPYTPGEDIVTAGQRYDALITAKGPIAVQILGIGANGHIGFNEPGSSLASGTRLKTLAPKTREDNARFFDSPDEVPIHVMTQGLGTISAAQHALLLAFGDAKARAIQQTVEGPITASCPATVLQLHPKVTVIVDQAAAQKLENVDYYKYIHEHKLSTDINSART